MKIEEAIETLEEKRKYCKMFYELSANPQEDYPSTAKFMNALELAITALRSMQEAGEPFHIDRSKWEYCLTCRDLQYLPHEMCADVKMPGGSEIGASFCPSCGRPLTEEAWAELERRLRG